MQAQTRILVVDDHRLFREGLMALLSAHPDLKPIGEAADAREGIELAGQVEHDVLIVDIALPGVNGIAMLRELKRREQLAPALVLTMYGQPDMVSEALDAGATSYALKHQGIDELVTAVHSTARRRRYLPPELTLQDELLPLRPANRPDGVLKLLSAREREIFDLLVRGNSNQEIGKALFISTKTVETHRCRIFRKLDVHSIGDLLRLAARHGLLTAA